jgi:hypothetical protein
MSVADWRHALHLAGAAAWGPDNAAETTPALRKALKGLGLPHCPSPFAPHHGRVETGEAFMRLARAWARHAADDAFRRDTAPLVVAQARLLTGWLDGMSVAEQLAPLAAEATAEALERWGNGKAGQS